MKKFLLAAALCLAAVSAHAANANVNLNWVLPVPTSGNPTDIVAMEVWDQPIVTGFPSPNVKIASLGPTVKTFTSTGGLAPGVHQFTVVAVYGEGSAAPSNVLSLTIAATLAPATGLTGSVVP